MTNELPRFIVGEISKNWLCGRETVLTGPLCTQFEAMLAHNDAKGYRLMHFTLHRMMTSFEEMNETIIAVFERRD